ncbi:MAG: LamG domain-containing protein [Planctomycetes bacterium]|nr:LamG domain-containing protein [Planctomycetota bacterium]
MGCYGWQNDYFDGLIDEVRVYNRALSAGEALSLAGGTAPF